MNLGEFLSHPKVPCACRTKDFIVGVQKYLPKCWKLALNGNLPLFSSSKNHSHYACHTHQSPAHSQCLESWTWQAFGFCPHSLSFGVAMVIRNGQFYHPSRNEDLVGLPNVKKSHACSQSHFIKWCMRGGWAHHPPPPSPPAISTRNWTKYNKSLTDPVRGAGSTQMQTQSYHARQSGNLARKVRNADPGSTALCYMTAGLS